MLDDTAAVGALLRAMRSDAGLTQAQVAEAAGLSPAAAGALERGQRVCRLDELARWARACGRVAALEIRRAPGEGGAGAGRP